MKSNYWPREVIRLDANSATVYMTREAIGVLVEELTRMASADPQECFEVHLGSLFSTWEGDTLRAPRVAFSDGLGALLGREEALKSQIAAGEVEPHAQLTPFEVTLMHVSEAAVLEETERPDD